ILVDDSITIDILKLDITGLSIIAKLFWRIFYFFFRLKNSIHNQHVIRIIRFVIFDNRMITNFGRPELSYFILKDIKIYTGAIGQSFKKSGLYFIMVLHINF